MMNLQTRFNTYSEMWNRRMRELEEGPLHFKARKRMTAMIQEKMDQEQVQNRNEAKTNGQGEAGGTEAANGGSDGPAASRGGNGQTIIHDPGTEDALIHDLYNRYVESMKKAENKKASLTYELFAMTVGQQVETLERIKKCDAVAVSIQNKDGKVKLKFKAVKEKS